jgi:hypothetical protein
VEGYRRHVKAIIPPEYAAEIEAVDRLAIRLTDHILATRDAIAAIHIHGARSQAIQDHFSLLLRVELGFGEGVVLTPQTGFVTQARPDFFFRLSPGIREAEVVRHQLRGRPERHVGRGPGDCSGQRARCGGDTRLAVSGRPHAEGLTGLLTAPTEHSLAGT